MSQPPAALPAELQNELGLPPNFGAPDPATGYYPEADLSGGLPINLDSLRDGPPGSKPFYPYSTLIRYAIKGSPTGKLLLEDIYYAIESRFPYFRTAPPGWKNSVRHNLSLNPCFVKVPRPLTDRGKGSYWTVDDNVDPRTGVHRIRKKKTKKSKPATQEPAESSSAEPTFPDPTDFAAATRPPGFEDPQTDFTQSPLDENGQPRVQTYTQPAYPPTYDPAFQMQMLALRYQGINFDEQMPVDANGQVDWRMAWHNELANLQRMTAEQDKVNGSEEWYRIMLVRLKFGLFTPFGPGDLFAPAAAPAVPLQGMMVGQPETAAEGQAQ